MYNGMPSLVDGPAVTGGQPDLHGAFPGYQGGYRPQQQPAPNWFQTAAAQGTPWQNAGAGAGWRSTPAGPSWANTPTQGASGWPTANQFQQQAPGWAPQMPRQGWGPATPGPWGGGHSGPSTPWDWPEAPPQSAPASLSHGFSATAAPPPEVMQQSSSGQPITSNSWFAQAARGGGGGGGHGVHAGMHGGMAMHSGKQPRYNEDGEELDSAYDEEEEEDAWPGLRAGWGQQDPRPRWPQTPAQDPRTGWPPTPGHDPWAQTRDPLAGQWPRDEVALARTRTISGGHPKSPGKTKKRSNSFGGGMPAWGARAMYDETHLAKRPEDWREGYSPRGAMGADLSFSSLFRVGKKSDSGDLTDTKKRTLSGVLSFSFSRPNIAFDVRRPPEASTFGPWQPHGRDMMQPAVTPAATRMRLMHPRLPWYVDVKRIQNTHGITLYDVLYALFEELDRPIAGRDFWNEELGRKDRDSLTQAFKERCRMNGRAGEKTEMMKGVKRVDFLGADCVFVGLVRRNGMWEIKTTNEH